MDENNGMRIVSMAATFILHRLRICKIIDFI